MIVMHSVLGTISVIEKNLLRQFYFLKKVQQAFTNVTLNCAINCFRPHTHKLSLYNTHLNPPDITL